MVFHPLYKYYEMLLNDILPTLENVTTEKEAQDYAEYRMELFNNNYVHKMNGFRLAFDTKEKIYTEKTSYKYKEIADIELVKTKVA